MQKYKLRNYISLTTRKVHIVRKFLSMVVKFKKNLIHVENVLLIIWDKKNTNIHCPRFLKILFFSTSLYIYLKIFLTFLDYFF